MSIFVFKKKNVLINFEVPTVAFRSYSKIPMSIKYTLQTFKYLLNNKY